MDRCRFGVCLSSDSGMCDPDHRYVRMPGLSDEEESLENTVDSRGGTLPSAFCLSICALFSLCLHWSIFHGPKYPSVLLRGFADSVAVPLRLVLGLVLGLYLGPIEGVIHLNYRPCPAAVRRRLQHPNWLAHRNAPASDNALLVNPTGASATPSRSFGL